MISPAPGLKTDTRGKTELSLSFIRTSHCRRSICNCFGLILTTFSRCACDVPAHCYSYSWEGNPRWSRAYVGATELYDYYKALAKKYGVDEFIRLNHLITSAKWNDDVGKWTIEVTDQKSGATINEEAEIFINGAGFLK